MCEEQEESHVEPWFERLGCPIFIILTVLSLPPAGRFPGGSSGPWLAGGSPGTPSLTLENVGPVDSEILLAPQGFYFLDPVHINHTHEIDI